MGAANADLRSHHDDVDCRAGWPDAGLHCCWLRVSVVRACNLLFAGYDLDWQIWSSMSAMHRVNSKVTSS
jgi:hypothetical protein